MFYSDYIDGSIHHRYIHYVEDDFFDLPVSEQTYDNADEYLFVREDGKPNFLIFSTCGGYTEHCYSAPDVHHCLIGPAITEYDADGKIWRKQFAINGEYYTESQFDEYIKNLKILK